MVSLIYVGMNFHGLSNILRRRRYKRMDNTPTNKSHLSNPQKFNLQQIRMRPQFTSNIYCEPIFICGDFISQLTAHKLVRDD